MVSCSSDQVQAARVSQLLTVPGAILACSGLGGGSWLDMVDVCGVGAK